MLFVHDVNKLQHFYTQNFGLTVSEEIGGEWTLLQGGQCQLALHKVGKEYANAPLQSDVNNTNAKIIFEISEDIREVRERFVQNNILLREVKSFDGFPYLLCDGEDPEGNVFQIKQQKSNEE